MKIVSVQQMRDIEAAVDASVMSYSEMMQQAGQAAAKQALSMVADFGQPRITILVGPGNNGGDGLVAAKALSDHSPAEIRLYMLKRRDDDDPVFKPVQEAGLFIAYAEDDHDGRVLRHMCASADLVIDALFGIGIKLPLREEAARTLRTARQGINERRNAQPSGHIIHPTAPLPVHGRGLPRILALDCPSGLDCDTGELDPNTIPANDTITFIATKHGQIRFPGAEAVGDLHLAPLDIPADHDAFKDIATGLIDANTVRIMLPERPANSNKGTFGKTMIAAGSVNYSGAAGMAAEAAYRAGAGLVTVAAPGPVIAATSAQLGEPTWVLLPHDMGVIAETAAEVLTKEVEGYSALLIGPGFGQEDTTASFLNNLFDRAAPQATNSIKRRRIGFSADPAPQNATNDETNATLPPLVIDADALNLLGKIDEWWKLLPEKTIITPHPGEMSRLSGLEIADIQANREQIAREKAAEWNVILLLKGAHTIIAAPDERLAILPFKSDALATAGTGDVLAGVIAGFLAQGLSAYDAAVVGGYVHGLAAEWAARAQGTTRSVIAGDIIGKIGDAFNSIERS